MSGQRGHGGSRWWRGCLGVLVALWATLAHAGQLSKEAEVKAEFLERFTRFIDWPPSAFAGQTAPFVVCLMGNHPFGDYIDKMVRDRLIKDRPTLLRRPTEAVETLGCHLLFVAGSEDKRLAKVLAHTAERPILTVSDTRGFAARGVLVNFYRDDKKVRFEINAAAAKRSGLKFSSKLLKLGKLVGGEP
jgi:hypothetical protein